MAVYLREHERLVQSALDNADRHVNIDRSEFTQVIEMDPRSGIDKPTSGRDHKYTGDSGRGPRKRSRICDLTAKIKAAEKGEHFRDRRAAFAAQFPRQFEFRPVVQ